MVVVGMARGGFVLGPAWGQWCWCVCRRFVRRLEHLDELARKESGLVCGVVGRKDGG